MPCELPYYVIPLLWCCLLQPRWISLSVDAICQGFTEINLMVCMYVCMYIYIHSNIWETSQIITFAFLLRICKEHLIKSDIDRKNYVMWNGVYLQARVCLSVCSQEKERYNILSDPFLRLFSIQEVETPSRVKFLSFSDFNSSASLDYRTSRNRNHSDCSVTWSLLYPVPCWKKKCSWQWQ
jgi:hypothetical protein